MLNNLKISGKEKNIRKIRKTIEKTENQKQKTNVFQFFQFPESMENVVFLHSSEKALTGPKRTT